MMVAERIRSGVTDPGYSGRAASRRDAPEDEPHEFPAPIGVYSCSFVVKPEPSQTSNFPPPHFFFTTKSANGRFANSTHWASLCACVVTPSWTQRA